MGVTHSSTTVSGALALCNAHVLKYVLGQASAHVKEIYIRFVANENQTNAASNPLPHPILQNPEQFSHIFTATNNDHSNWMTLFELLDPTKTNSVDFYEAIATVVSPSLFLFCCALFPCSVLLCLTRVVVFS